LQECEAIVYYLYQNNQVLESFIQKYPQWREQIRRNGDLFKSCGLVWQEVTEGAADADRLSVAMSDAEERYMEQNIPCPFLENQLCSIYEVRPYSCVSCIAVSPPEWCNPQNLNKPEIRKVYPVDFLRNMMTDYSFYYTDLDQTVITFMPIAVYEILKNGPIYYSSAKIPPLERLDYEFFSDPEVIAILRRHGVVPE
jgi:Fe-S-cluster containining protein